MKYMDIERWQAAEKYVKRRRFSANAGYDKEILAAGSLVTPPKGDK